MAWPSKGSGAPTVLNGWICRPGCLSVNWADQIASPQLGSVDDLLPRIDWLVDCEASRGGNRPSEGVVPELRNSVRCVRRVANALAIGLGIVIPRDVRREAPLAGVGNPFVGPGKYPAIPDDLRHTNAAFARGGFGILREHAAIPATIDGSTEKNTHLA